MKPNPKWGTGTEFLRGEHPRELGTCFSFEKYFLGFAENPAPSIPSLGTKIPNLGMAENPAPRTRVDSPREWVLRTVVPTSGEYSDAWH